MPILDEKDIEKMKSKENKSVTMHEDSQRNDDNPYEGMTGAQGRTVAFNDDTYNITNMTTQEQ